MNFKKFLKEYTSSAVPPTGITGAPGITQPNQKTAPGTSATSKTGNSIPLSQVTAGQDQVLTTSGNGVFMGYDPNDPRKVNVKVNIGGKEQMVPSKNVQAVVKNFGPQAGQRINVTQG